ncbi:MAG TPA: hypothetical protein VFV01_17110 [Spirillospora sp.]|nr:hypothetical protein [Spirillospora sp.]
MIQTVPAEVPPFADRCPQVVATGVGFTAPYPTLPCYLPRGHDGPHRMGVEWTTPLWVVVIEQRPGNGIGSIWGPFETGQEARTWAEASCGDNRWLVTPLGEGRPATCCTDRRTL